MTHRLLLACDSNPAEYAPQGGQPCRAWTTYPLPSTPEVAQRLTAAGWRLGDDGLHRCPACSRAMAARGVTDTTPEPAQEAPPCPT